MEYTVMGNHIKENHFNWGIVLKKMGEHRSRTHFSTPAGLQCGAETQDRALALPQGKQLDQG